MNLEIIQDRGYLKKQQRLFKTPSKILLNSFTGYYFLTEYRAKNYFEHVIGMILLQSPGEKVENICVSLMSKYSRKLETYKSKGEKKEMISVIILLLLIVVVLLSISLFVIAIWYKSIVSTCFFLLASACVVLYITSIYSSYNDKKIRVLKNVLSSLNEIVESYNLVQEPAEEEVAEADILSILKFMFEKKYITTNFEFDSYSFNPISDLGAIPMTNIVRILRILESHQKIEFSEEMKVNEFANTFASYFKISGKKINAESLETTFNNLTYDETCCDLDKINKKYKDVLSVLFNIKN